MKIRIHGVGKICSDVWLAVSEEEIAGRERFYASCIRRC